MLEELTCVPLSKRRENACLILFYKIINNLAVVPHSCIERADGHTRKKHSMKFRHIGYNVDPYRQSFFPKSISVWNGLAQEIAEANTLDLFKSKLAYYTPHRSIRNHICERVLLITESEYKCDCLLDCPHRVVTGEASPYNDNDNDNDNEKYFIKHKDSL